MSDASPEAVAKFVISYPSTRLTFRKSIIGPLSPEDNFRIETPVGFFEMCKADFLHVFDNVVSSNAYQSGGVYHYPTTPRKALPFFTRAQNQPAPVETREDKSMYPLPEALKGKVEPAAYRHWIKSKAAAHVKRDSKRWNRKLSTSAYRKAIHLAASEHDGRDPYTGEWLRWDLLRTYDNEQSKAGRTIYKRTFRYLPTIDHVDNDACDAPKFRVISWEVNDAKNDMTHDSFIELCRRIAGFSRNDGQA